MSMSSNILPARFDNGDFECWLREFDACSDANGWKVAEDRDDKITHVSSWQSCESFLCDPSCQAYNRQGCRGGIAKIFVPRRTARDIFCSVRSPFFTYKWELEQMLDKADPDLSTDAKTALVQGQFMKGFPNVLIFKLLEHNQLRL